MKDFLPRRMLRREAAATYCAVSPNKFDALVKVGTLPPPRLLDGIKAWDRQDLDAALDVLPVAGEPTVNEWDATL